MRSRRNPEFCAHTTGLQTSPECVPDTNLRRDELLQIANGVVRIALDAHLCAREQKVTQRAHTPGQRRIHLPSFRACRCTPPQSLCSAPRVLPAASSPPLPLLRREGEKKGKEKQYCGKEGSSPLCFRFPSFLSWLGTPSYLLRRGCHGHFMFTVARTMFMPGQHCRTPLFAIYLIRTLVLPNRIRSNVWW